MLSICLGGGKIGMSMKFIDIGTDKGRKEYARITKKYLKSINTNYFCTQVVTNGCCYEWKAQKNGLIKYTIQGTDDAEKARSMNEILKEIEKKGQIIIMETKRSFTVMIPPQDVSECV